jgi:ribonuclease BN (tRNA processing enzyme)
MGLSVTVLGCSGTYAGPGGACSGYLIRSDETSVWVDTGPGSLGNLQQHIDLTALDAIAVSHSHPDHWGELGVVRNALKYGSQFEGMPLYSTSAVRQLVDIVCGEASAPTFGWGIVADGDTVTVGDLELSFSETDHPVETLAMRIASNGESVLYSADTGPGWSLEALGRGADMALCEATLLAETEGTAPHLSARQAGQSAADAKVGQLVVTHFWPTSDPRRHEDEAAEAFGRAVGVAVPGKTFTVS